MKVDRKLVVLGIISLVIICIVGIGFNYKRFSTPTTKVKKEVVNKPKIAKDVAVILETVKVKETTEKKTEDVSSTEKTEKKSENVVEKAETTPKTEPEPTPQPEIVYDGLTLDELATKLNRSLGSSLSGYGYKFASRSLELGVDPYLAVAIVLHETGCSWSCSALVQNKNNVGGMVGNGGYIAFASLDAGIDAFLNNLYKNYYAYGLTTPEQINKKYAASTAWASKINYYIGKIKAS